MKSHLLGTVIMETMIADIHSMQTSKERMMKISFTEWVKQTSHNLE